MRASFALMPPSAIVPARDRIHERPQTTGSLTTLRENLIKIGAKVLRHSKYVTCQMGEVAVSRELFAAILERIQRFGVPPPLLQRG